MFAVIIAKDRSLIDNGMFLLLEIIFGLTAIFFVFKYFGLISNFNITKREERPGFLLALCILFLLIFFQALNTKSDILISVSGIHLATTVIFFLITLFWKISHHMTMLLSFFSIMYFLFPLPYLIPIFSVITILIGWSRIELKAHNFAQVIAGIFLGLMSLVIFIL